jgi:hypothetical protein
MRKSDTSETDKLVYEFMIRHLEEKINWKFYHILIFYLIIFFENIMRSFLFLIISNKFI